MIGSSTVVLCIPTVVQHGACLARLMRRAGAVEAIFRLRYVDACPRNAVTRLRNPVLAALLALSEGAGGTATENPNVLMPAALSTNTAPLCISATALTIDKPSP